MDEIPVGAEQVDAHTAVREFNDLYAWIRAHDEKHAEWPGGADVIDWLTTTLRRAGYDMDYPVGPTEWTLELLPSHAVIYSGLSQSEVEQKRLGLCRVLKEGIDYRFVPTKGDPA